MEFRFMSIFLTLKRKFRILWFTDKKRIRLDFCQGFIAAIKSVVSLGSLSWRMDFRRGVCLCKRADAPRPSIAALHPLPNGQWRYCCSFDTSTRFDQGTRVKSFNPSGLTMTWEGPGYDHFAHYSAVPMPWPKNGINVWFCWQTSWVLQVV
jgi:hypothetical protein